MPLIVIARHWRSTAPADLVYNTVFGLVPPGRDYAPTPLPVKKALGIAADLRERLAGFDVWAIEQEESESAGLPG